MGIMIQKRNGRQEVLDIEKIQKHTISATQDLDGVSQSEVVEYDLQAKDFKDLVDAVDKNSITLGVNERFSSSASVQIANQNNVDNKVELEII